MGDQPSFHWACQQGDIETVKLLMDRDALDINAQNYAGVPGFQYACQEGQIEIVKLLMDRDDLDINNTTREWDQTALYYACMKGQIEVVKLLADRDDLNINAQDHVSNNCIDWFIFS